MTTQPTPSRREMELQLIRKAWSDAAFAQQLREDPRTAVEQVYGAPLPAGITVQVLQETPTTLYLVVPPPPDTLPEGQLTDADLEMLAAGAGNSVAASCLPQCAVGLWGTHRPECG